MEKLSSTDTDRLGPLACLSIDSVQNPQQEAMEKIKGQLRNHGLSHELLMAGRVASAEPQITDTVTLGGLDYPKYPLAAAVNGAAPRLTPASLASFLRDLEVYRLSVANAKAKECRLVTWLWLSMGEDVKMYLRLNSAAMQAVTDSDVYAFWPCILKAATTEGVIKSVSVLNRTLTVSMQPGEAHVNYAARLKHLFRLCQDLFQSTEAAHKGYIKMDTLFSILYLYGLDKNLYEFILNKIFSDAPSVHDLLTFEEYSLQIQQYSSNRHVLSSEHPSETSMAYVAKLPVKEPSSSRPCAVCSTEFVPLRPTHAMCRSCASAKKSFPERDPKRKQRINADVKANTASVFPPPVVHLQHAPKPPVTFAPSAFESVPSHLITDEVRAMLAFQASQFRHQPSVTPSAPFYQSYDELCLDEQSPLYSRSSSYLAWSDFEDVTALSASAASLQIADNAATLHCTKSFAQLVNPRKLLHPIPCGGVGAHTVFTHVGIDPAMPLGARDTFWGPIVQADLRSLGYLSRRGMCAYIQDVDKVLHCYYGGELLFSAPMQPNHLYPFDSLQLASHPLVNPACMLHDADYWQSHTAPVTPTGLPLAKIDSLRALHASNVTNHLPYACTPTPAAYPSLANVHFNAEQMSRIDQASDLLKFLHFPSSAAVATGLSMGAFSLASKLDAVDMYNHDRIVGPNPHFLAGQFTQKPMPASTNPPAPSVGHTLSLDIRMLDVKSPQGYTHAIHVVSENEGYYKVVPSRTGKGKDFLMPFTIIFLQHIMLTVTVQL